MVAALFCARRSGLRILPIDVPGKDFTSEDSLFISLPFARDSSVCVHQCAADLSRGDGVYGPVRKISAIRMGTPDYVRMAHACSVRGIEIFRQAVITRNPGIFGTKS